MTRWSRLAVLAAALCAAGPARADDSLLAGTLKTIQARGTILLGYRTTALPFSFLNKAGQPIGFTLDLCQQVAADVAHALNVDLLERDAPQWQTGLRIVYVPVAADERLPKIVSGEIDLECGSTTANRDRARTVAFSPVFFLAGTKLLVPAGSASSYRDLAGKTVVVGANTTNAEAMRRLAGTLTPPIKLIETLKLDAAYDILAAGKADAMASDDILLSGFAATRPDGRKFTVIGDYLSFEPYAIILRRDDPAFASLVQATFQRLADEGALTQLYDRWFMHQLPTGETLNLPISAQLAEMYAALGRAD